MKKTTLVTSALCVAVLSGCTFGPKQVSAPTSPESQATTSDAGQTASPEAAPTTTDSSTQPPTSEPSDTTSSSESSSSDAGTSGTVQFGQMAKFDNGVELTVSKPSEFELGRYASPSKEFPKYVKVEYTLKNTTDKPLELFEIQTNATSGDTETRRIIDIDNDLLSNSGSVLPGKSRKWSEGYGVNEKGELTLEIRNGFGRDASTIFVSN